VLYESGDVLLHVYFPVDCIVSLLYVFADGSSAEIAIVGNDGLIGIALFMGGETTPNRTIVQSAGHAYRILGQRLKDEFHRNDSLRDLLLRYTQALINQMAQTAVCNRHHSVDQQLRRWLLLSLDRLSSNQQIPTHCERPHEPTRKNGGRRHPNKNNAPSSAPATPCRYPRQNLHTAHQRHALRDAVTPGDRAKTSITTPARLPRIGHRASENVHQEPLKPRPFLGGSVKSRRPQDGRVISFRT
jgi:hypothetical protein